MIYPAALQPLNGTFGQGANAPDGTPTLAFSARTGTTITVTHTPPNDLTDYSQTRIYVYTGGALVKSSDTSATAEDVALSGLSEGTEYVFVPVPESAAGTSGAPGIPICAYTLFSASTASQAIQIKAAIAALISSATGVEGSTVHTRIRRPHGMTPADFSSLFEIGGIINGWEIEEEGARERWIAIDNAWRVSDRFFLRGYYSHNDSASPPSETTFRGIVQNVIEALNADHTLSGTVRRHYAVQMREWRHKRFTNEVVHFVDLLIETEWDHQP